MNDRAEMTDEEARAWLKWQVEMGADEAIAEQPTNYFAREIAAPPRLRVPQQSPSPARAASIASPPSPPSPQPARAPESGTLEALRDAVAAFDGCGLKRTAKSLCFYRGAAQARVMLIGEAPGRDEDLSGQPFVGRAGQMLDRMLSSIGLDATSIHITNIVYWRPPGNRNPTPEEIEACRPFLTRQIELVGPDCIVALGGPAAKQLTGAADGIMRMRGRWRKVTVAGREIPLLPTLHPAYLLRTPAAKRLAWRDLLALRQFLRAGQR